MKLCSLAVLISIIIEMNREKHKQIKFNPNFKQNIISIVSIGR